MEEQKYAELKIEGRETIRLRAIQGTEGGLAIDVSELYKKWGILTCDPGYMSTGSCYSAISYIDGEKGILRYRGYNIYDLAMKNVDFVETAWLLIHGNLPNQTERRYFRELLTNQEILHEGMLKFFDSLPPYGDPMPILSAAVQCSSLYHPELRAIDPKDTDAFMVAAAKLISKVRTIAAFSYKKTIGMPFEYPDPALDYCSNFLHMMYSLPYKRYGTPPIVIEALNLFLMLHADHELSELCASGLLRKKGERAATRYQVNPRFEYLGALNIFIRETTNVRPRAIISILRRAGTLQLVALSGFFSGVLESRIDLLVVGDHIEERALASAVRSLEAELGREIRYASFATTDFRYRTGVYDRLLRDVFDYPHRLLIDKIGL